MADTERVSVESTNQTSGRWLGDEDVLDAALPAAFRTQMSAFLDADEVATLGDWVAEIRALAGGGVDAEQLCHADEETPHRAVVTSGDGDGVESGETFHFRCFYDAVALAHIRDERIAIRTESPDEDVVRATATGERVETTPASAVMSFGVATDVASTDGDPAIEDVYGAICPYVRAFRDRSAYEAWADGVDAETVGLPLDAGVPVAAALVE